MGAPVRATARQSVLGMSHLHITSPLIRSEPLSALTGVDVYLKLDNIQPSGTRAREGVFVVCFLG